MLCYATFLTHRYPTRSPLRQLHTPRSALALPFATPACSFANSIFGPLRFDFRVFYVGCACSLLTKLLYGLPANPI